MAELFRLDTSDPDAACLTVRRYHQEQNLPAARVGRELRYLRSDCIDWLRQKARDNDSHTLGIQRRKVGT